MSTAAATLDAPPFLSFAEATQAMLGLLRDRLGTGITFVGRIHDDDWVIVDTHGDGSFELAPGQVIDFRTTFCSRMLRGAGPRLAQDARAIPAYAETPVIDALRIGAYVGVPIRLSDGELYGTLCGLDRDIRTDLSAGDVTFVETIARMLAWAIERERAFVGQDRRLEALARQAETDPLTGLLNRRGWDLAVAAETARTGVGDPLAVAAIDLDGLKAINDRDGHAAGDELILAMARALSGAARSTDVVARLGGDEFGVLLLDARAPAAESFVERVRRRAARVAPAPGFSVGIAVADLAAGLPAAIAEADQRLLANKAARRQGRPNLARGQLAG